MPVPQSFTIYTWLSDIPQGAFHNPPSLPTELLRGLRQPRPCFPSSAEFPGPSLTFPLVLLHFFPFCFSSATNLTTPLNHLSSHLIKARLSGDSWSKFLISHFESHRFKAIFESSPKDECLFLACCDSWGRKESDTTERLNWTEVFMYRNNNPTVHISLLHIYEKLSFCWPIS